MKPIHYEDLVKYKVMDAVKRLMGAYAAGTYKNLAATGGEFEVQSKGGSVALFREGNYYRGLVLEQLGTKNRVAEIMRKLMGTSFFYNVAIDTAATIFNDAATAALRAEMGVMFIAAGSEEWFKDMQCVEDYARGWQAAFNEESCAWGGGETGTLGDLVFPNTAVLAGAVMGKVKAGQELMPSYIRPGNRIVLLAPNGPHANGITALRKLADDPDRLPQGYLTPIPDGRTFGEAILDPTPLYGKVIHKCQEEGLRINYAVNISGHGMRKLMRSPDPFRYVIEDPPAQSPFYDFAQEKLNVGDKEFLGTYAARGGFALYTTASDADGVVAVSQSLGIPASKAGVIYPAKERSVEMPSLDIKWGPKDLDL